MRKRMNSFTGQHWLQGRQIAAMNAQQHVSHAGRRIRVGIRDAETQLLEQDAADQGVTIGMETIRFEAEQDIACTDPVRTNPLAAFYRPDNETGQIVFTRSVEVGHFSGFAAAQRAAVFQTAGSYAANHLLDHARLQCPHADVIEKEKRLCPLHQNVIDAMVDQVVANRVVATAHHGDLELGAYAVGAGN